jgi:very-short-patch-repair endonuclease
MMKHRVSSARRQWSRDRARTFRRQPTDSEAVLWRLLRGKKLCGLKFRRQQPIGPYIVDFFCAELRLVVEVDGEVHNGQREADAARQQVLEQLGLRVVRLQASAVEADAESVIAELATLIGCGRSGSPDG